MPFPMPTSRGGNAGTGIVGVIVVIVISLLGGGDPGDLSAGLGSGTSTGGGSDDGAGEVAAENFFLAAVFTDLQDYW